MNNTTKRRTWSRLAAAVFLAALVTTALVIAQQPQAPAKKGPARMAPGPDLGLTAEQQKAIEEFRKARIDENQAFREEMMKLREEMRGLAKDPKANESKINALIDKRAKLQADRDKAAFKNRVAFEKILTPEQLEKMRAFRGRMAMRPGFRGLDRMGMGRMGMGRMGMGRMGMGRMMPGRAFRSMDRARAIRHRGFFWRRWFR